MCPYCESLRTGVGVRRLRVTCVPSSGGGRDDRGDTRPALAGAVLLIASECRTRSDNAVRT